MLINLTKNISNHLFTGVHFV